MRFRVYRSWPLLPNHHFPFRSLGASSHHLFRPSNLSRGLHMIRSFTNGGANGGTEGNSFPVSGAAVGIILMLGVLHARHIYVEKKIEDAKEKGIELEFSSDAKAAFLRFLPLRSMSHVWGLIANMEIPVWLRPSIYKAWAQAFHSNLEEAALPLDNYASLREFFIRSLREGSRTVDSDPYSLVSPVDGTILKFGELEGPGAMIEQVKGFSYSASALLGSNTVLPQVVGEDMNSEVSGKKQTDTTSVKKSWWRISLSSPKVHDPLSVRPVKGIFYCVIYLKPGDYHRVHSPVDWNILCRRHFSGRLFPLNERAVRTIRNLYVENERVVLEGQWAEGFMAVAAIGATNIGSIELFIEPELRTNRPIKKWLQSGTSDDRVYEPEGVGMMLKKGKEVAAFNMGSTVVLVFQAPVWKSPGEEGHNNSQFNFCVRKGQRIQMGEALGRWN
ncbi:hypothetical protein QJS10_CPB20g01456 [Acorus calamus]|uniref:Phosphatidylserine decarboxylase proenzyme 1, mitochondrial n=1 Tax=Acorus calamus TaxID=4465 RepID=A0AAV9C988_ACOCL|nr:hypothetical protein QJS10_CPB20g01456 [Acorus calamus]